MQSLSGDRFALVAKTHHALVDGISGVDITTVLFDTAREPVPTGPPATWSAKPLPGQAKLLGEALLERSTVPNEMMRGARALLRAPRRAVSQVREGLVNVGATTLAGVRSPAPPSPFNVEIGPHRRYTFIDADLERFKAIKDSLGGTLNDAVLTSVTLALGRYLRRQGVDTEGLVLKAMVPVSVRTKAQRGALGNQVAAMWAPLPVGVTSPPDALSAVAAAMEDLKSSGQAVGAQVLTNLAGFAPPTILSQAARLQARQQFFNLVVTNVPGPQFPLYLLGRELRGLYPGRAPRRPPGARHRRDELQRPPRLRAARRLRRAARARRDRRRPQMGDRIAVSRRRARPHRGPRQAQSRRGQARPGVPPPRRRAQSPPARAEPRVAARMRLALCQINATVGDIAGNARQISDGLSAAREAGREPRAVP